MKLTAFIATIVVIALGIYDLFAVVFLGIETSISQFLINIGFHSPAFVFCSGFVCGHVFGWMTPKDTMKINEKNK